MQISVDDPKLKRFIEEQVQAGHFASAEALVQASVTQMMLNLIDQDEGDDTVDAERLAAIEESEAEIARGEDRDFGEVAAELRKKYLGA